MEKTILHPGNGVNFPIKGDYVKYSLELKGSNGRTIFNSEHTKKKYMEIRYKCTESTVFDYLEELIGEMCLFERCSLELDNTLINKTSSKELDKLLQANNNLCFIVEIINISKTSHF